MAYRDLKKFRIQRKKNLILAFGGKCQICGYNKCDSAFDLHHINSFEKEFSFSQSNTYANLNKLIEEAEKCALLCSNCHREIHSGLYNSLNLKSSFDKFLFVSFYKRKEEIICETCGSPHKNEKYCSKQCLPNKKYNWDIEKLLLLKSEGFSNEKIAKIFNVSGNSVRKKLAKITNK